MKIVFYLLLFILLISPLSAKIEVDKAFVKRGYDTSCEKSFSLYSPDVFNNQQIKEEQVFDEFGCKGKNIPPKLVWKDVPANTKSFAVTMFDNDARTGSGWWHWIVYNIPANVTEIGGNASYGKSTLPKDSIQGINDYGVEKYGGVCPPKNERHRYTITVYALDIEMLKLKSDSTPAMVNLHIKQHEIDKATIDAFYGNESVNNSGSMKKYKFTKTKSNSKGNKNVVIEN
jgi:Raf kinase inhibitor-like YbhB/YbcL family protein